MSCGTQIICTHIVVVGEGSGLSEFSRSLCGEAQVLLRHLEVSVVKVALPVLVQTRRLCRNTGSGCLETPLIDAFLPRWPNQLKRGASVQPPPARQKQGRLPLRKTAKFEHSHIPCVGCEDRKPNIAFLVASGQDFCPVYDSVLFSEMSC